LNKYTEYGIIKESRGEFMKNFKKAGVALLVALCMIATMTLAACGGVQEQVDQITDNVSNAISQAVEGDITGQVGKEYSTRWFDFTVNSMVTGPDYEGLIQAASGNTLVIANITITNTFGSPQPFGTFDWFVDDDSLADYIFPHNPVNNTMMPEAYTLEDGETVTYDVVVEFPANLANPYLMYIEADQKGETYNTFRIPIK